MVMRILSNFENHSVSTINIITVCLESRVVFHHFNIMVDKSHAPFASSLWLSKPRIINLIYDNCRHQSWQVSTPHLLLHNLRSQQLLALQAAASLILDDGWDEPEIEAMGLSSRVDGNAVVVVRCDA